MSRELDEACALAMGWKREERINEGPLWRDPNAKLSRYCSPPAFSSDAACIPEMVAWLKACQDTASPMYADLTIHCLSDTDTFAELWTRCRDCEFERDHDEKVAEAQGCSLSEVLSRLVVAVGDAKEKP